MRPRTEIAMILVVSVMLPGYGSVAQASDGTCPDALIEQTFDRAYGINDAGQVVGAYDGNARLWDGGAYVDLGTLGGDRSEAYAINSTADVAGWAETAAGDRHAFLYSGTISDLGTLGGSWSEAYDINDSNQIVGASETAGGETHAFLWQANMWTDLGTLGGTWSAAYGVNAVGQVVGAAETAGGEIHAFVWDTGVMTDLGTLGGIRSEARDINTLGEIVGWATQADGTRHAFLYDGVMIDLDPFVRGWSEAYALNDDGVIVGYSDQWGACIWANGGRSMLNAALPPDTLTDLRIARDINNFGDVVGTCYWDTVATTGFVWEALSAPCPTPTLTAGLVNPGVHVVDPNDIVTLELRGTFDAPLASVAIELSAAGDTTATLVARSADPNAPGGLSYISQTSQDPFENNLPQDLTAGPWIEALGQLDFADPPCDGGDGMAPGTDLLIETLDVQVGVAGTVTISLGTLSAAHTQCNPGGDLFDFVQIDPAAASVTLCNAAPLGDIDENCLVRFADFELLSTCMAGPDNPNPGCDPIHFANSDLSGDGDVDLGDFGAFQSLFE